MSDFLRRAVWNNFGLKLLSLVLAVGLWLVVARDPVADVAVEVPIEFSSMPQDLMISSETIPRIQIRLSGPQRLVRRLQPSDVYYSLDLGAVKTGERTFDLIPAQVHKPSGIQVDQVIPSQFHVAFDLRETRQVPVKPKVVGALAAYRTEVEPSRIIISGPQERVSAVESATTDPVDVSGVMDRMSVLRHAYVSDPLIQVANPDPVRVTVIMEKAPAATSAP